MNRIEINILGKNAEQYLENLIKDRDTQGDWWSATLAPGVDLLWEEPDSAATGISSADENIILVADTSATGKAVLDAIHQTDKMGCLLIVTTEEISGVERFTQSWRLDEAADCIEACLKDEFLTNLLGQSDPQDRIVYCQDYCFQPSAYDADGNLSLPDWVWRPSESRTRLKSNLGRSIYSDWQPSMI